MELTGSMRAVVAHPFGGAVAMAGFPGLARDASGHPVFIEEQCRMTLCGLRAAGAAALTVAVERAELPPAGFDLLRRVADDLDLPVQYHPIVDYGVPSEDLAAQWQTGREARAAVLRRGGTLAFCCQHGAGRSGLLACWTLMEGGLGPNEAMALVRSHFPQAVETDAQEAWLRALVIA